jgi:hypothetical protein
MPSFSTYFACGIAICLIAGCQPESAGASPAMDARTLTQFQQDCVEQLRPTSIVATVLPSQITYDFSLGVNVLTKKGTRQHALNQRVIGLTTAALRHSVTWGSDMLVLPGGAACTRPAVSIILEVGPQLVNIGKEFAQGTCAFKVIVEHELRHVQANQDSLDAAAQTLETEMRRYYGTQVLYGEKDTLKAEMTSDMQRVWLPLLRQKLAEVNLLHDAIDSPAEYAHNQTVCDGTISRTLSALARPSYAWITPRNQ